MIALCEEYVKNHRRNKTIIMIIIAWLMMICVCVMNECVSIKCYKKMMKVFYYWIINNKKKKTGKWKIIYWNKNFLRTTKKSKKYKKKCEKNSVDWI